MEDKFETQKTKVPLLGDIPILGFLFRQTETNKSKSNLLIFLTPHVIHDAGDFLSILKSKTDQRNQFFEKNYSEKQLKNVKDLIKTHREDLLEIQGRIPVKKSSEARVPAEEVKPPVTIVPAGKGEGAPKEKTTPPPVKPAPKPQPSSPVISITPGQEGEEETGEDLDLAY